MVGMVVVLGSGCEELGETDWLVKAREVHINVTTRMPAAPVPCTLAIEYVNQSVNIGSDYEAGVEYDVIVNGERQGTFIGGQGA
jgi:hypothetical protein